MWCQPLPYGYFSCLFNNVSSKLMLQFDGFFTFFYLKIFCKVGLLLVMRTRYYYENVMCYFYFALIFVWEILIHVMFLCKKKSVLLPPKKVFYLSLAWYYSFWKYKIQNTWFTYFISRKGMFFNDQRQVRNLRTCV